MTLEELSLAAETRLGIKAGEGDLERFRAYLEKTYPRGGPEILDGVFGSGEAASFLTVNETYFFRESAHFHLLRKLLPDFYETLGLQGTLRICSAASSIGCEALSIAALIENHNRFNPPLNYRIDAFDINPRVIQSAREGIYGGNCFREDGGSFRYALDPFIREVAAGRYGAEKSLLKNIRFFVHNLMEQPAEGPWDMVFFRNAFIYFSPRNRPMVLSNLAAVLEEGGILIMGVSETASVQHPSFVQRIDGEVFYFQKAPEVYRSAVPE